DAVSQSWKKQRSSGPLQSVFLKDWITRQRLQLLYEAAALASFSGIAIFLACLGLFGLSVSTAERRTKEIGIRKAMGANSGDVTRMLLWQFAKPVLWANVIAWPVSYYFLNNWLNSFAYHITLSPLVFVGATL